MLGLRNHDRLLVGYDIGDDYAQMSYAFSGEEPETLSSVAGEQKFNIPAVLCKRPGVNQWFYGKEALRYAAEENGILVQDLFETALDREPVQIEGESYEPVSLLTLFVKRTLGMLSQAASQDKIYGMMMTCENMDAGKLEVLTQVVKGLRLKTDRVYFQSHGESYYNYMLYQPAELWTEQSVLCDYRRDRLLIYHLECNRKTTPAVVFAECTQEPFFCYENMPETEELRRQRMERLDREFLEAADRMCRNRRIGSVYLIGENFSEEWMKESLRALCRGRRVFQGNNLYSKGACYGVQERIKQGEEGKKYVFLGNDKLRANIGMKIWRQGEETYLAILDAGVSWYECDSSFAFYIQGGNSIEIMITPLIGKGGKLANIILEDLPEELTRLEAHFYMTEENCLTVEFEDLGLGGFREATHHIWKEELTLYEKGRT